MSVITVAEELKGAAQAFYDAGKPIYYVGGAVRNTLMGLPKSDIDMTGTAMPEEAVAIARSAGAKASVRDTVMGTVDIHCGGIHVEYTPFRTESYGEGGEHRPQEVIFTQSMEEDALRRDFTVNAIYADALTGEVHDPMGGEGHLQKRVLYSCRPPMDTLKDDGVRILRMVRFACQLHFAIDPQLYRAAKARAGNLQDIAMERKREECYKILLSDGAYPELTAGIHPVVRGLNMLWDLGILNHLFPELMEGESMEQPGSYHRYTVLRHNMMVCASVPCKLHLRLAGLLHDVAKPRCYHLTHGKMHGHDRMGVPMAERMLKRLKADNRTVEAVCALIGEHMFDLDGRAKESTCRKRFSKWGFGFTEDLIELRKGDIIGSGMGGSLATAEKWARILHRMQEEGAVDSMAGLAITGKEIMDATGLPPGPIIGRIKEQLYAKVAVQPRLNRKEVLVQEAKHLYKSIANMENNGLF